MNKRLQMLKKWISILSGKNVLAVEQGIGKIYSKVEIMGYYNDLTNKVKYSNTLDEKSIPVNFNHNGEKVYFPIAIAQVGLGAYDLFLLTKETSHCEKFINAANWLLDNQEEDGGWDAFERIGHTDCHKYSAMAQGEGASILIRAYLHTNDTRYYNGAIRAIDLMLKPVEEGGTARYLGEKLYLEEYVKDKPNLVLNGWVFAIFGLLDVFKLTQDVRYKDALEGTLKTLTEELNNYDTGYWSFYDQCGLIASPFYHNLHIALLNVLYDLFEIKEFQQQGDKWSGNQKNIFKKTLAVCRKAMQKIINPGQSIIVK